MTDENCRSVQEYFSQYLAGAMDEPGRRRIEEHADACPACARLLVEQRELSTCLDRVRAFLRSADADGISETGERRIIDRLRKRVAADAALSAEELECAAAGQAEEPCPRCGGRHAPGDCPFPPLAP